MSAPIIDFVDLIQTLGRQTTLSPAEREALADCTRTKEAIHLLDDMFSDGRLQFVTLKVAKRYLRATVQL